MEICGSDEARPLELCVRTGMPRRVMAADAVVLTASESVGENL